MSSVTCMKGHSLYISCRRLSLPASASFLKAPPMPSQTGRCNRVCVHAKIQGMARRSSMLPAALRLAGRDPMLRRPSSLTGVADWKYSMKRGSFRTTSLYASHDTFDISTMTSRHSGFGALVGARDASSTALVYRSRVRKAASSSPNCCSSTSPCTVTRMLPLMVLGGCDRMARWVGPPPRPTVPPRPWNRVSFTLNSLATLTRDSCTSYSPQAAAMRPASLPLSE
mmetsp:Transcript_16328/g.48948  ORF Transcript_16328/g.48948 Transcript_16328/m.48948 type:complete len:226 (-) Transcript_16328:2068-2745(-)